MKHPIEHTFFLLLQNFFKPTYNIERVVMWWQKSDLLFIVWSAGQEGFRPSVW